MKGCVRRHFEAFLGPPTETLVDGSPVSILAWKDPDDTQDVLVTTVGMAEVSQTVPPGAKSIVSNPRTELLAIAKRGEEKRVGEILLGLSLYPRIHGTFLHWGHDVPLGVGPIQESAISHIYFSFPPIADESFATFVCDGERIDVLWAMPITAAERDLKAARGGDALERALENIDIADLARMSAIS